MPRSERAVPGNGDHVLRLELPGDGRHRFAEAPLRFVETDGHVEIVAPEERLPRWAEVLSGISIVSWRIGRRVFVGRVIPIASEESDAVLDRFEAEFGADRVRRWFGRSVRAFELVPTIVKETSYPEMVESYFDSVAPNYEQTVANNSLEQELRKVSVEILLRIFQPGNHVLELGCGTGLETLALASSGVGVLATDISAEMIRVMRRKVVDRGLDPFVEARQLAAHDVGLLVDEFGPGSFSGAFSTYGALNCEENLESIPGALALLLRPKSAVLFGVWNRYCAAEFVLSMAGGNLRRAFARLRDPVPVGLSRYGLPVHAYSFRSFVRRFSPYFSVERVVGVPVFVPPYDYNRFSSERPKLLGLMRRLDKRLSGRVPFSVMGDHFLVVMRRF